MNKIKIKIQEYGFTKNHFQLIALAMVGFVILVFAKTDATFKIFSSNADVAPGLVSYEQTKAEIEKETGYVDPEKFNQDLEQQFALLDRGQADGKVLGEVIGIGEIPDAEQLYTPEVLQKIKLVITNDNSQAALESYAVMYKEVKYKYDVFGLLSGLNSDDKTILAETSRQYKKLVDDLAMVPVPSSMENYHKLSMVYFNVLGGLADIYAGNGNEKDMQIFVTAMMSLSQKIQAMESSLLETKQISL